MSSLVSDATPMLSDAALPPADALPQAAAAAAGAPTGCAPVGPRRNDAGVQICEVAPCTRRWYELVAGRNHGNGRACSGCISRERRAKDKPAPAAPAAPVTPPRSHKKKPAAPAAASAASPPPPLPSPPPIDWPLHLRGECEARQWSLEDAPLHRKEARLAQDWSTLARDPLLHWWDEKREGFEQHDARQTLERDSLDKQRQQLLNDTDAFLRSRLGDLGVDDSKLRTGDVKIIRMRKGKGEQRVHMDMQWRADAQQCYSGIFYVTDTLSTAVPTHTMDELEGTFIEGEHDLPADRSALLDPTGDAREANWYSIRVKAGASLVFRCDVPHFGVANPDDEPRLVIFFHYAPKTMRKPDSEEQRYPLGIPRHLA